MRYLYAGLIRCNQVVAGSTGERSGSSVLEDVLLSR